MTFFEELQWRGLVQDISSPDLITISDLLKIHDLEIDLPKQVLDAEVDVCLKESTFAKIRGKYEFKFEDYSVIIDPDDSEKTHIRSNSSFLLCPDRFLPGSDTENYGGTGSTRFRRTRPQATGFPAQEFPLRRYQLTLLGQFLSECPFLDSHRRELHRRNGRRHQALAALGALGLRPGH